MAAQNMPVAEVDVTVELVRRLLADQHADLAALPLELVANGWDNAIFRLGDDLCVRLPRRQVAAALIDHEQRWLPALAPLLPIPIPVPLRTGRPGSGYPWSWSVCPWFAGEPAADVALADAPREARRLGEFVRALHQVASPDVPPNPFLRGGPIGALDDRFRDNVDQLEDPSLSARLLARWEQASSVDEWHGPGLWVHGDLHTANVVVADGAIGAVIDFGDIASGDPAVDLAIAWMLFGADDRAVFRQAAGDPVAVDDATWSRAEAWALHFGVLYVLHSGDNPRFQRMGRHLLAAVLAP